MKPTVSASCADRVNISAAIAAIAMLFVSLIADHARGELHDDDRLREVEDTRPD